MSSGPRASAGRRVLQLAALLLLFVGLYRLLGWMSWPTSMTSLGALVLSVGFLRLAGHLAAEVTEVVHLPHLTGYILAGVIAGPHVLDVVDHHSVAALAPVSTLALALIALAGGAELELAGLRRILGSLVISHAVQMVLGLLVITAIFVLLAPRMPFLAGYGLAGLVSVGLLWSTLAVSRSPSATLAIMAQTRPDGPITRFSLAFIMSSDVVVVLLLALVMTVVRPFLDPGVEMSAEAFSELRHELLGSVSLGTTVGLLLALYLRFVGGNLLIVLVAMGFGLTAALRYLRFDPLLSFLIAGFVVRNLSKQGERLLAAIERVSGIVFIVFFASTGAHLDLPLLARLWPYALALAAARAVTTIGAHRLAGWMAQDPPLVRRLGWTGLVSQAGLTLGLGVMIERSFPRLGGGFSSLVVATVALNEVVGPVIFKLALERAGEIGRGKPHTEAAAEEAAPPT